MKEENEFLKSREQEFDEQVQRLKAANDK